MAALVPSLARSQPVPLQARPTALPAPSIVVLWATWCAPCREELRRLVSIAREARPLGIVTLALDSPERAQAVLRATGADVMPAFADERPPVQVLAQWGGGATLLPLAVALDSAGRVCGRKRGLLGTDQLRQWARSCR